LINKRYQNLSPAAAPSSQKRLAEFAPAGANKVKSFFSGDMRVGENTSQPASVESACQWRADYARGGLHPARKNGKAVFSTVFTVSA
jgi:hypothetical protein